MSDTLPTITFTYMGKTITAVETAPPSTTFETSTTTSKKSSTTTSTKSSSAITKTTSQSTTTATKITQQPTTVGPVGTPVPASCTKDTTTISDPQDARALATACPTFMGDVLISSEVSTPIDLSGMRRLNGSLLNYGSENSGFTTLSSNDTVAIWGNFSISNTKYLSNISFPAIELIGAFAESGAYVVSPDGGLTLVNNSALQESDSWITLNSVNGNINLDGNFTSVSFPILNSVLREFNVTSSNVLDCATVAPELSTRFSGYVPLTCTSGNATMAAGTHQASHLSTTDKIIAGVVSGAFALLMLAAIIYCYLYKRTMRNVIDLVKSSKRGGHRDSTAPAPIMMTPQTPAGVMTPQSTGGFSVHRASDNWAYADPQLHRQLMQLNELANRPGGLNPDQIERRAWITEKLHEAHLRQQQPLQPHYHAM